MRLFFTLCMATSLLALPAQARNISRSAPSAPVVSHQASIDNSKMFDTLPMIPFNQGQACTKDIEAMSRININTKGPFIEFCDGIAWRTIFFGIEQCKR